jgi:hypothetical protein
MPKTTVWTPFAFSVALSVITVVTYIASGLSDAWIITFLCFLPLSFHAACFNLRETRGHIKELEARIQRLEADRTAAS